MPPSFGFNTGEPLPGIGFDEALDNINRRAAAAALERQQSATTGVPIQPAISGGTVGYGPPGKGREFWLYRSRDRRLKLIEQVIAFASSIIGPHVIDVDRCSLARREQVITLRTRSDKERGLVHLSVSDTGCGIGEDIIEKIFDPFFTTQPVGQGTGLGLSICHTIIKQHGGSISVESTEGLGSTFTIRLPVSADSKVTW